MNFTTTKERNILRFRPEGKTTAYVLDLATGQWLGLSGKEVQTFAHITDLRSSCRDMNNNLGSILCRILNEIDRPSRLRRYTALFGFAERLDAINLPNICGDCSSAYQVEELIEHEKELIKFLRNDFHDRRFNIRNFYAYVNMAQYKAELGRWYDLIPYDIINYTKNEWRLERDMTQEDWGIIHYYAVRGKMWEFCGNIRRLMEYFEFCELMGKAPQKENNFMREYCETKTAYGRQKEQYDNEAIARNYAKQAKAFNFTHGNYTIVVPTCGHDIVREGERMHHCVGGYVDNVVKNDTYIVFVRPIDNPDACYITAQVHTNGNLGQYFLAYDKRITKDEDREFYTAFQNHLTANWNRE